MRLNKHDIPLSAEGSKTQKLSFLWILGTTPFCWNTSSLMQQNPLERNWCLTHQAAFTLLRWRSFLLRLEEPHGSGTRVGSETVLNSCCLNLWRVFWRNLVVNCHVDTSFYIYIYIFIQNTFGLPPHPVTITKEDLYGFPTKNGIILVVTVTAWGVVPYYTVELYSFFHNHGNGKWLYLNGTIGDRPHFSPNHDYYGGIC